jgi:hypothetical protein
MKKMNRIKLWAMLGLLILTFSSEAQTKDWQDRMFLSFNTSTYLDFVKSPIEMVETIIATAPNPNDPGGPGIPVLGNVPYQSIGWSLFSLGLEPRFNLYEMDQNASLAVSVPISFGLCQVVPASDALGGKEGFGSLQIPVMLKLYLGFGSTYESEKDFGLSLGMGMEYNKLGLISVSSESSSEGNKGWMMPAASLGIHFWRGTSPMEINLKYGFRSPESYYIDKYGEPLKDRFGNLTEGVTRANSFKVSIGYLLNY